MYSTYDTARPIPIGENNDTQLAQYPPTIGSSTTNLVLELGQDLLVAEEEDLLTVQLHGQATVLGQQHLVAHAHGDWDDVALAGGGAGPDGQHLPFIVLADAALRDDDATGSLHCGHHTADEHAVSEGDQLLERSRHDY